MKNSKKFLWILLICYLAMYFALSRHSVYRYKAYNIDGIYYIPYEMQLESKFISLANTLLIYAFHPANYLDVKLFDGEPPAHLPMVSMEGGLNETSSAAGDEPASPAVSCPFKHNQSKLVPIMYGLLMVNEELERKIANLEVWPGGCTVWDEKYKTVCAKCGYAFESLSQIWHRTSSDPSVFQIPLHPLLLALPVLEKSDGKPAGRYRQIVTENLRVTEETLSYRTTKSPEELQKDFNEVLAAKLDQKDIPVWSNVNGMFSLFFVSDSRQFYITLVTYSNAQENIVEVNVTTTPLLSNK